MLALLYKDFESYKTYYLGITAFFIAFGIYFSISEGNYIFLPAIFFLMVFMISTMSIGVDEQNQTCKFLFSAPIQRKQYVLSKFLPGIVFSLIGGIATFFTVKATFNVKVDILVLMTLIVTGVSFIILDIITPILLHFGANKGRIVMVVLYLAVFSVVTNLKTFFQRGVEVFNKLKTLSPTVLSIILVVFIVGITALSITSSVKIVERKEY